METIIDGVDEPLVCAYFTRLNQGEFGAAAALFAMEGCLQPPFEAMIQGRQAIAAYLEKEAKGMVFCPESGNALVLTDDRSSQFFVRGKVETSLFVVSVKWLVQLNSAKEITVLEVKLLDSLHNLLNLRS